MRRREDRALLVGAGRYVDDLVLPGMVHVVLVRSPHAHARVLHVDVDEARRAGGVIAVFTAADVGDIGPMPVNRMFPDIRVPPHPILGADTVHAQGEPVVAVVAESTYAAADAAALVRVEYEPLPGVASADDALAADAPLIVTGIPTNRSFSQSWRAGDPDGELARALHVVSVRIGQARVAAVPLEPRAALATWDRLTEEATLWTSTQAPFRVRADVARMLGLTEARVRVIAPDVGGGFGVKGGPYREEVLVTWLARRLARPVKWVSTRAEDLVTTHHGRGSHSEGALAVSADGRMLALRVRIRSPLGSAFTVNVAGSPRNHARCLPGPYVVRHVDIEVTGAITTTPPVGPYRGAGRPEAAFLMERLVDLAARATGIDPADLRRRNLVPTGAFPFTTATGQSYDSGDYVGTLDETLAAADYAGLRKAQVERRARGEIVGIGVAAYVEPSGLGWESGLVRVERTGSVTAITGSSAHGQGHETTFAQVVADFLGVDPASVVVRHGDTRGAPHGIGTFGSRSVALGGGALALAARDVRDKACRIAASLLEASAADIEVGPDGFHVAGSGHRSVPWRAIAEAAYSARPLAAGEEPGLEATRYFRPEDEVWSAGAVVAVVSVDRETGVVTVERLVWVDDAGTIVNPLLAEGQLHGSLAQAIGQVMGEAVVLDRDGHVLSGTLMDYMIPRATDVPRPEIGHGHSPSPRNPLGAKGLGEAGTIGIPPAVVGAVVDALAPFGVEHLDMPLTSEKVWRALVRS